MKDASDDVRVYYNGDGGDSNPPRGLTPEAMRLLTQLLTRRGFQQLAEIGKPQADLQGPEGVPLEWEEMPSVAKEYQSEVAGDRVKVDDLETLDVKASLEGEDPAISFEDKDDSAGWEIDDVPFW